MKAFFYSALLLLLTVSCTSEPKSTVQLLPAENFTKTVGDKTTALYTLTNAKGSVVQLTNFGASVVALWVPDKDGVMQDVAWGLPSIDDYLNPKLTYCGPIVGRFGNRIGDGKFTLNDKEYQLTINDGKNHLHGGNGGFEYRIWDAEEITADGKKAIKMTYVSPDGEEGYPGNLTIAVTYSFTDNNELVIDYEATTDAPTVLNPTSHVYYNLSGTTKNTILNHMLRLNADAFTLTDDGLIPTGEIAKVEGTPLDFTKATAIGERINADYEPLKFGKGYDHNFVLNKKVNEVSEAAYIYSPESGISMTVLTDQPAIQFYSGNFWDGTCTGKRGEINNHRCGFALEAQNYPDAPNHDNFPSSVLNPGEKYTQHTVYKFGVVAE